MYPNQPSPPDQQPMYQEQPSAYESGPNPNRKKALLLVVLVVLVVASFAYQFIASHHHNAQPPAKPTTASAVLVFNSPTDSQGISAQFNGNALKFTGSGKQLTYTLKPGTYALTVTKSGYKPFTANFTARTGEPVQVIVNLQPAASPTPISSIGQIAASGGQSLASLLPPGTTVTQKNYFDNNTWAVMTFNTHTGIGYAVIIAQFNPSTNSWVTAYGPSDDFEESALQSMPSDLQTYVNNNFYVQSSS